MVLALWILIFILSCNLNFLYAAKFKDADFKAQLVVKGLTRPTSMIFLDKNDILVSEKQGKVQRIIGNQTLKSPVLDITSIVNSTGERGLLSIGISHPKSGKNQNNDNAPSIYILFTKYVNNKTTNNFNCVSEKCETLQNAVNSLYRYKFKEGELINPKLLANIPLYSNDSIQHIGGAIAVGPDDKIYFTSGDGRGCEYFEDCASKASYVSDEAASDTIGGIYYLTDRSSESDYQNDTTVGEYYQYAYGIRNSFGFDFDPVTGNLWDTENGPTFGDELNLVRPGFNSGWPKIQGIWPTTNHSQLYNNPPPGLPKGYYFSKNTNPKEDPETFKVIQKGRYSSPEFTWNQTVGVTSLAFFHSKNLGEQYENDMFVGTFKGGYIYHFDLNKDRDQLLLKGPLGDKIAKNNEEMNDVTFAQGLGPNGITDLEVGPDGYLYVLTHGIRGAIYKIVPTHYQ